MRASPQGVSRLHSSEVQISTAACDKRSVHAGKSEQSLLTSAMQWQAARTALLLALVALIVPQAWAQAAHTRTEEGTLVVYSYRQSDPEALGNFQHFLDNVLSPRDPARYIIVVDHNSPAQHGHMSLAGLPRLPTNAQYLSIKDCYELGHVGKVLLGLSSKHVSTEQYDYFVWLDSSVKRSIFPTPDAQGDHAAPWHSQLTSRISSTTKLIGASISCEAASPSQVQLLHCTALP